MGKLRSIKVFVLGEVVRPGTYDISSLGTVFLALQAAGGPTKKGSLRNIQLKRSKKIVKTLDYYDFVLKGDRSQDIQLTSYDTIFIPPIENVVKISGEVKRSGIFEFNNGLSIYSAIKVYSGGFSAFSYKNRIQFT